MTTLLPKYDLQNGTSTPTGAVNRAINLKLNEMISVEDFGAVGDGTTDDQVALQAAFTWSATNKIAIYLEDKRYYTSATLNCNGAIIRSFSGQPGAADPYFLGKPDGTFVYTTPSVSYYMDYSPGISLTWAQMIAATSYGCAIISDQNIDILQITGLNSFNIEGIAVIGNHRATSQVGIASAIDATTQTASQYLKNVNVIGCGTSGIYFRMGLQEGFLDTVNCLFNNGDGMTVSYHAGVQCAVDYNIIQNCHFQFNRGNGLFFSYISKHCYITGCDFSGNGQYENGQQPGGSYVDPLLGYDRTPPTNAALMAAGIWINDSDNLNQGGFTFNVAITECQGELMACGIHIRAQSGIGAIQFLRIQNVSFYRDPIFPYSGGNNGVFIFLDVLSLNNSLISENYNQSLNYIDFPSGIPPTAAYTNNSNLFLDNNATSTNATSALLNNFLTYKFPTGIGSKAPTFGASSSTTQTISNASSTKIVFDVVQFDTDNAYDHTTNYRFQPTIPGYYRINVQIAPSAAYTSQYFLASIYKNGVSVIEGNPNSGTSSLSRSQANGLVYLNGSTDYVEAYAFQNSGGNITIVNGAAITYFQGNLEGAY